MKALSVRGAWRYAGRDSLVSPTEPGSAILDQGNIVTYFFLPYDSVVMPKSALLSLSVGVTNQTLHQTPESHAVMAKYGADAGEFIVTDAWYLSCR